MFSNAFDADDRDEEVSRLLFNGEKVILIISIFIFSLIETTKPMLQTSPVQQEGRAKILDALRGFAVLGILLDNIFGFSGYGLLSQAQREAMPTWPADGIIGLFETAFIRGKFYSLFSLLFGIGFSIILVRNERRGTNPLKIFYRRLAVLLFIGTVHLLFMWDGDILMLYALLGMLLPLFRKCKDRTLLIYAVALIASPIFIDIIKVLLQTRADGFLHRVAASIDAKNNFPTDPAAIANFVYAPSAGWKEFRIWQDPAFFYRFAYLIESNRLPKVLGMFLVGFYAGRKMMYARPEVNISRFKKLRKWGFIIGIPANIAVAFFQFDNKEIPHPAGLFDTVFYAIGVVPLSLAYVSTICLFWIKTKGKNVFAALAPAGRMALTNYLLHTVVCITIFYGIGFGLGAKIGPSIFWPMAFVIYGVQVIASDWWLRYFHYGPVEWIWRQLTYGKVLPLRRTIRKSEEEQLIQIEVAP